MKPQTRPGVNLQRPTVGPIARLEGSQTRISPVAPHPSRMGMWQSMRMPSNGGDAWSTACTAACPLSTTVHRTPARSSMRFNILCEGAQVEVESKV